jgi:hypothetical protein
LLTAFGLARAWREGRRIDHHGVTVWAFICRRRRFGWLEITSVTDGTVHVDRGHS